jgi:thioredoxin reductase
MTAKQCIAILGAGPAGLSAALWLRNLGFETCVLEATARAGGLQNLNFLANEWVLGQVGQTGPALSARLVDHAARAGVQILPGVQALRLEGAAGVFRLHLSNGRALPCVAVLVATGTRYRGKEVLADIDGASELPPQSIMYGPYAFADLDALAGKRVLVIGGGDNAFENARLLVSVVAQVHLAIRSQPRVQQRLAATIAEEEKAGRCRVLQPATVRAIFSDATGLNVTLAKADGIERIGVDRIHVLVGYEPNTAFLAILPPELRAGLCLDAQGYLVVDAAGRSGVPGIYAAGDVCNPRFPSVVSALAQGARAAKTIEMDTRTT